MSFVLDRRSLLGGISAIGALTMIEGTATAATATPFFQRVGLPIGLQIYTLGDEAGRDLDATFRQVAAIGFREIELPSLYGRKPAEVRTAADRAGLKISSLHIGVTPAQAGSVMLTSDKTQIAETLGALGAKRAVLPIVPIPATFRPVANEPFQTTLARTFAEAGEDIWKQTAALLNERAAALKPLGIALGYHNHNIEFAPVGKTTGWDILLRECDPRLVSFEIDVGWVATAGRDPATFLQGLKGRVTQLHIKDVAATNTTNFALSMQPAEVGSGKLDWARILPAAHAAGVRHFYVEQEAPFTIPRIEAARKSYDFLASLRA
jgi:sugar phosphate isomerase/epimerase